MSSWNKPSELRPNSGWSGACAAWSAPAVGRYSLVSPAPPWATASPKRPAVCDARGRLVPGTLVGGGLREEARGEEGEREGVDGGGARVDGARADVVEEGAQLVDLGEPTALEAEPEREDDLEGDEEERRYERGEQGTCTRCPSTKWSSQGQPCTVCPDPTTMVPSVNGDIW